MTAQNIKILIVEDDRHVARDIRNKLEGFGYRISDVVNNGGDAIAHATEHAPDLVLMDILLPGGMDGIETAAQIQDRTGIPIIYLTGYSDQVFLDRAKITDPMAYILKPASDRDLHAAITLAMHKAEISRQREENNLLNATLVSFAEALLVWNLNGRIVRVNQALLEMLQATEPELLGQDIATALSLRDAADNRPVAEELIYRVEQSGHLDDETGYTLHPKQGAALPVRVCANRILDRHQQCYGYVMQIRDDTQRRQYETSLLESETRFRQLVSHIESVFLLSDLKKKQVLYVSPAYEKIYGHAAQSTANSEFPIINQVHMDDRKKANALIRSIHQKQSCTDTLRVLRRNGEFRWISIRCYPVTEADGHSISRFACIIDDVTDAKQQELKLQQAAKVFDNTAEGILITDAELNIVAVNRAFCTITGYAETEVLGLSPQIIKSDVHDHAFYQNIWKFINNAGYWQGEITSRRKNGEIFPQWATISTIHDDENTISNYVAIMSDISSLKDSQEKLEFLAHHDHLTGFANRLLFNARLKHAIEQAERNNQQVVVLLMDLDRFKDINDGLGHAAGDDLLRQAARRLKTCLREEDTLARLGSDEFIFILENLAGQDKIEIIAQKIQQRFAAPFLLDNSEVIITVSMGISIYPDNGRNVAQLIKHADIAMYKAKQQGKNCFAFYSADLDQDKENRLMLSTMMRQALDRNEFIMYYQPQISSSTGRINGMEALIRWQHPEKGLILPIQFIPLAEETGFIQTLGEWILSEACRQCKIWHEQGFSSLVIAVNLSARQFMYSDIVGTVKSVLAKTGLDAQFLELEITESHLMESAEQVIDRLDALKALGLRLSIDDFGTGYSSLSYLKRFPLDKIKIDRSFVKDIPTDSQDAAISRSIIALGKSLNLSIIPEGVETESQRQFMTAEGCDEMQGNLFSRPLPAEDFVRLLENE